MDVEKRENRMIEMQSVRSNKRELKLSDSNDPMANKRAGKLSASYNKGLKWFLCLICLVYGKWM